MAGCGVCEWCTRGPQPDGRCDFIRQRTPLPPCSEYRMFLPPRGQDNISVDSALIFDAQLAYRYRTEPQGKNSGGSYSIHQSHLMNLSLAATPKPIEACALNLAHNEISYPDHSNRRVRENLRTQIAVYLEGKTTKLYP